MKKLKYSVIIVISELLFFYGFLMLYILEYTEDNKELFKYAILSVVGVYFSVKYNLLLRQMETIKSSLFSIVLLCFIIIMYWFNLEQYNIKMNFLDWNILYLIVPFIPFAYGEYIFRFYPLEKLEKKYK